VRVDFHSHLGDDPERYVPQLLERMDLVGIDCIVVFSPNNKLVESTLKDFPDRLIGFAFIHPYHPQAVEDITYFVEQANFRGVKMSPTGETGFVGNSANINAELPLHYYPNDEALYPVYAKISDLGAPLLFHSGVIFRNLENPGLSKVKYCQPIYLDDVARDFPDLKLVVAHGGRPFIDQTIALSVCPNVYIDITWSLLPTSLWTESVRKLLEVFGADRLIYGSDVYGSGTNKPKSRPSLVLERYQQALHMLEHELRIDATSVDKIMGGNACKLLHLSR
jgi:predicted TIM-barrel fold metal-dependent hydrolase